MTVTGEKGPVSMWTSAFENELSKHTECPDEFLQAAAVFAAGSALANRVVWMSPKELTTNLYVILSSPPGRYRKSTAIDLASDVLMEVVKDEFLYTSASMEAMAKSIAPMCDRGYGHGVFVYDEMRGFMELVRKEYGQAIFTFLLERWQRSSRPWRHARKGGGKKETGAVEEDVVPGGFVVSFFTGAVYKWFVEHVASGLVESGMASRFLLFHVEDKTRDLPDPPGIPEYVTKDLAGSLWDIREAYSEKIVFSMTPEARKIYNPIYRDIDKRIKDSSLDDFASVMGRAETYVKKLSLLNAAISLRDDAKIHPEDVEAAWMVVSRSINAWEQVVEDMNLGTSQHGRLIVKIKKVLKMSNGAISKRNLLRKTHASLSQLDEALITLSEQGAVVAEREGKRVMLYLKGESEDEE